MIDWPSTGKTKAAGTEHTMVHVAVCKMLGCTVQAITDMELAKHVGYALQACVYLCFSADSASLTAAMGVHMMRNLRHA